MEQNNGWALAGCQGVQLEPLHRYGVRNDQLGGFSPLGNHGYCRCDEQVQKRNRGKKRFQWLCNASLLLRMRELLTEPAI